MNPVQMGLSFDETIAEAAFSGSESWCSPEYTHDAYKAMLDTACAHLHDVPSEIRQFFEQSIESCLQALQQEKRRYRHFSCWLVFVEICIARIHGSMGGIVFSGRRWWLEWMPFQTAPRTALANAGYPCTWCRFDSRAGLAEKR